MRNLLDIVGEVLIDVTGLAIMVGFIAVAAWVMATNG